MHDYISRLSESDLLAVFRYLAVAISEAGRDAGGTGAYSKNFLHRLELLAPVRDEVLRRNLMRGQRGQGLRLIWSAAENSGQPEPPEAS